MTIGVMVSCHAALSSKRPAGWVDVGKLIITLKDERPSAFELRDGSGKKVDSGEVTVKSPRAAGAHVAQKICLIGGVLAIYDAKPAANGTLVATVVKPAREDEGGDVVDLCKEPAGMTELDEAQKRRAALDVYEERLTSPRWRTWLFEMTSKVRKVDDPAARAAAMTGYVEVLAEAAARSNIKDCWFANALLKK